MKNLMIVSPESFFGGYVQCGMAEITDSLACSLAEEYSVTVVCFDANGLYGSINTEIENFNENIKRAKIFSVEYFLIQPEFWLEEVVKLIELLKPDILHNMAEVEIVSKLLHKPNKTVYTFDSCDILRNKEHFLLDYNTITTHSNAFAKHVLEKEDLLSLTLKQTDFRGVINGILDSILSPDKGLLLSAPYTAEDLSGKTMCKKRLMQTYNIKGDPFICLVLCRLVPEKGLEKVIEAIPTIQENGGVLLVVGKGLPEYEETFRSYAKESGVIFINKKASPQQLAPLLAGADFLFQPSVMESGGLMPLTASRYGTIPIITLNGGLSDSFNYTNAIVIDEKTSSCEAIRKAALLYNTNIMDQARSFCMKQEFSWKFRKVPYINIYEQ